MEPAKPFSVTMGFHLQLQPPKIQRGQDGPGMTMDIGKRTNLLAQMTEKTYLKNDRSPQWKEHQ